MEATISAVIQVYGAYSAALEREYIRSQQRPPDPLPVRHNRMDTAGRVAVFMEQHPGWWTVQQVQELLALEDRPAWPLAKLLAEGKVERFTKGRPGKGRKQLYRWVR